MFVVLMIDDDDDYEIMCDNSVRVYIVVYMYMWREAPANMHA